MQAQLSRSRRALRPAPAARPARGAEEALLAAILDGTLEAGARLPAERELAGTLGVTRPTLREVLQRLHRDGWITISHGRATVVNDVWREGGLNVLGAVAARPGAVRSGFVAELLQVRQSLAPAYARAAVQRAPEDVAALLAEPPGADAGAAAWAAFDWRVHHALTLASGNPIYTWILNGFRTLHEKAGERYFAAAEGRERSKQFYRQLGAAAARRDARRAERVMKRAMDESLALWERAGR